MPSEAGSFNRIIRLPQLYVYTGGLMLPAGVALSLGDFSPVSPWMRTILGLLVFLR